jgi:hypothetical protein
MASGFSVTKCVLFVNGVQVATDFELTHRDEWRIVPGYVRALRRRLYIAEWRTDPGGVLHHRESTTPIEVYEREDGLIRYDFWENT